MPYELTLRPRSATPVCKRTLRNQLTAEGFRSQPGLIPCANAFLRHAWFQIMACPDSPAGAVVLIKIPCGLGFMDMNIELLNLERLAGIIDAGIFDDREMIEPDGPAGLASIFALHSRYEHASQSSRMQRGVA